MLFKIGEPIPLAWLHMTFDMEDTEKYRGGVEIPDKQELDRLVEKYLDGNNAYPWNVGAGSGG